MIENIELSKFPRSKGVYWFKDVDGVVVYVGSSKNLYMRMNTHIGCIKKGGAHGGKSKQDFYQFLQNNQFTVEFTLEEDYLQVEQQLIEKYSPKYNNHSAYTGCGSRKEYSKQYQESHKEKLEQYQNQYNNQVCNYNGEILTLNALSKRFYRAGIPYPTLESKKYLIS